VKANIHFINSEKLLKYLMVAMVVFGFLFASDVFAAEGDDIGTLAANITKSFKSVGELILAIAFVAGLGFVMAAIFKFKQHKDNPTQIPLGTPIALLAIGVALIFLPGIIKPAGETLGIAGEAGGFEGGGSQFLPGAGK